MANLSKCLPEIIPGDLLDTLYKVKVFCLQRNSYVSVWTASSSCNHVDKKLETNKFSYDVETNSCVTCVTI